MRDAVPLPVMLLLVVAMAWLSARGTAAVPLPLVLAWTLAVLWTGIWLGVNAQASVPGPPSPPRDDGEDGMAR